VKTEASHLPHALPVVSPPNSTEEEAYHGEIYSKGAMIIHSLRGVLGDEVFFPMLKAFASDDRFTYQNKVSTQDFTDFVQKFSGQDLQGFFDLYLLTIDIPTLKVSKKGKGGYLVSLRGIYFQLPLEIQTSEGIQRIWVGSKPTFVSSASPIEVDPKGWIMMNR
jgi:aminopeptidase N